MSIRTTSLALLIAGAVQAASPTRTPQSDLERTLDALRAGKPLPVSAASVSGLNWYQQFALDSKLTVIVVSRNLGGSLLCFDSDGRYKALTETEEVLSVQLVRLFGESWDLLLTSLDGFGTGVRYERFHLFTRRDACLVEVWDGDSYLFEGQPGKPPVVRKETLGFVRASDASAGFPAQLLYYTEDASSGSRRYRLWEVSAGRLVERKLREEHKAPGRVMAERK